MKRCRKIQLTPITNLASCPLPRQQLLPQQFPHLNTHILWYVASTTQKRQQQKWCSLTASTDLWFCLFALSLKTLKRFASRWGGSQAYVTNMWSRAHSTWGKYPSVCITSFLFPSFCSLILLCCCCWQPPRILQPLPALTSSSSLASCLFS